MDDPIAHADAFARLRDFRRGKRGTSSAPSAGRGSQTRTQQGGGSGPISDALHGIRQDVLHRQADAPHGMCELCSLPLTDVHRHLFEVESSQIVCACDGCTLTFHGVPDGRYRPVPRDHRNIDEELVEAIPWEQLSLPINLAFFVRDDDARRISAYYPSPGGVTKSTLPFDSLDEIFNENSILGGLEPYVEALLVNRLTQKTEAFVVPIDLCYELTGLIRVHWRGFSGGEDVRQEMTAFFDRIRSRAQPSRST